MRWHGKGFTDIGQVRQINQDAFGLFNPLNFWVVADGMGGHAGGEIASRITIETVGDYMQKQLTTQSIESNFHGEYSGLLKKALELSNQAIRDYAREHLEYMGMGTTVVALHISRDPSPIATIAHAGDSRAYLMSNQSLSLLTRDHSMVEERIDLGIITPEQALTHPLRHVLTRALGIEKYVETSITEMKIASSDRLLLCTDGLTKMMTDKEIAETIFKNTMSLDETCEALIKEANQRGGNDNVTVVVVGAEGNY